MFISLLYQEERETHNVIIQRFSLAVDLNTKQCSRDDAYRWNCLPFLVNECQKKLD